MKKLLLAAAVLAGAPAFAQITGWVFTPEGKPLERAAVAAYRVETPADVRTRLASAAPERKPVAVAATDADGAFVLDAKPAALVELRVAADGYAALRMIQRSDDKDVAIGMHPARPHSGKVLAAGAGVKGALVVLQDEHGLEIDSARTDASGAFTVGGTGEERAVTVLHPKYARVTTHVGPRTTNVALGEGIAVSGVATMSDGKPAANARLLVDGWPAGTAGEDGAFTLARVPDDAKTVTAIAAGEVGVARWSRKPLAIRLQTARSISGSVRDDAGKPFAGVRVMVWSTQSQPTESLDDFLRMDTDVTITDAKGAYRFDLLTAETYLVAPLDVVSSGERAGASVDLRQKTAATADLTVAAKRYLQGIVRDERKRPVGGAVVMDSIPELPVLYTLSPTGLSPARTATAPNGAFRLPVVDGREGHRVVIAQKPGFAAVKSDPITRFDQPIAITLRDGIEIQGIVRDRDGKPIAGAGILAIEADSANADAPFGLGMMTAHMADGLDPWVRTAADGTFAIRLGNGQHSVIAAKEGYVSAIEDVKPRESAVPVKLVLDPAVEVRGRVVDPGGAPIAGAVTARADDGDYATAEVESDGTFVLPALRAGGEYMLRFAGTEGEAVEQTVTAPAKNVVLRLAAAGEIRGRVFDKITGKPLTMFSVGAEQDERMGRRSMNPVENDGGAFSVRAPAGAVTLRVRENGYIDQTIPGIVVDPAKPAAPLEIALQQGRTIRGRVTAGGAPVAHANVQQPIHDFGEQSHDALTDEEGAWQMEGMPLDAFELEVRARGYMTERRSVPAGSDEQTITIALTKGREMAGRVVDESGNPIGGASVTVSGLGHDDEQTLDTFPDGTFRIEGLGPGRFEVTAKKRGRGAGRLTDVDPDPAKPLTIVLGTIATGRIRGTVAGYVASSAMAAMVTASNEDGVSASGRIARDGTYRIDDVPAGEVSVGAMVLSTRSATTSREVTATVPAGGETVVDLVLASDVVIRGMVSSGGRPVAGARVDFSAEGGNHSATTSASGTYEVAVGGPGRYAVSVSSPGSATFDTVYDATGPGTFDIAIAFAAVEGRAVDEAGTPIAGVRIAAARLDGDGASWDRPIAVTDAAGAFRAQLQASTAYRLSAAKEGFADATATLQPSQIGTPVVLRMTRSEGLRVRLVDARDGTTLHGYVVAFEGSTVLARGSEPQPDGAVVLALPAGAYRIAGSASGYASQSVRASVPSQEVRLALTPGGSLVILAGANAAAQVKLVLPNGEEYVQCHCNGIAEIRLAGRTTTVEHVAPGSYALQLLGANGRVLKSIPVTIREGATTTVDAGATE